MTTLLTGLVAYWPLKEPCGNAYSHNNKNILVPAGGVGNAPGLIYPKARRFDGVQSYLSVPSNASLQMSNTGFTIMAWVNGGLYSALSPMGIVAKWKSGVSPREYILNYSNSANRFTFAIRNAADSANSNAVANTFGAPLIDTWYFLVAQYDLANQLIQISVNNGAFDTAVAMQGVCVATADFYVGGYSNAASPWYGTLGPVALWKRVLTSAELTTLYNGGVGLAYPWGVVNNGPLVWHVNADWNNDRVYESDEGSRFRGITIERGRESWLEDPFVGRAEIVLANYDRRYDNWNPASPLYGKIVPGARIQVSVDYGEINYNLFTGRVEDPQTSPIRAAGVQGDDVRTARIVVHDGWQWLKDQTKSVALLTNTNTKAAIQTLLNATGWTEATGLWKVGSGALGTDTVLGGVYGDNVDLSNDPGDVIPYWWVENEEVLRNLVDLVNSNWGSVYIAADGRLVWRSRNGNNGTEADLVLTDAPVQEMTVSQPWTEFANYVSIMCHPRTLGPAAAEIWKLADILTLQPGESRTLLTQWTNSVGEYTPATAVITPIATTDYTANSKDDGSGTDLTAQLGVTITIYSSNASLVVTNNAAVVMFVTLLRVRGQLIEPINAQALIASDTASIEARGMKQFERDLRWQQKTLIASDLAMWLVDWLKSGREVAEVTFESNETSLQYDLHSKILDTTLYGPGGSFRIARISHQVDDPSGQTLMTTWKLVRVPPENYWLLGTSALGTATILGM